MMVTRSDSWQLHDDEVLAQIVLQHIREGSTQLLAFDEVGEKLGRTGAACGFRWNSSVRHRFDEEIRQAKQQRMTLRGKKNAQTSQKAVISGVGDLHHTQDLRPVDDVISFLRNNRSVIKEMHRRVESLTSLITEKKRESTELSRENEKLRKTLHELQSSSKTVHDDYDTLLRIMERFNRLRDKIPVEGQVEEKKII